MAWIPKKIFWAKLKAGTLPPDLQAKYSAKASKPRARKTRRTRKGKRHASKSKNNFKKQKGPRKLKSFTVYVGGVEQNDKIESFSNYLAEKIARKMYQSKNILLSEE